MLRVEDLPAVCEQILRDKGVSGARIIFATFGGSRLYNLNLSTSDSDIFAVWQAPNHLLLALEPIKDTFCSEEGKDSQDHCLYELHKFGHLLLAGNPHAVEMLFVPSGYHATPEWELLRGLAKQFLSQVTLSRYLGYCKSHLVQISRGTGDASKKLSHVFRLLGEAARIIAGDCPMVAMSGEERDFLLSIKTGESAPALVQRATSRLHLLQAEGQTAGLPADNQPCFARLNQWVLALRLPGLPTLPAMEPLAPPAADPVAAQPEPTSSPMPKALERTEST
eukprot:gnl/Hemi2/8901_TR3081_c0_g1_i1.p1 gnl/Hemi2/8901_TR3081_c0_g1~~gnl/Hemi2/8901_TR3081_c0_g1_i1.p1  ORF type:complete len:280 (-),score=59.91 gnl/Hemi2/8901_TR3081_c0_g1_i1:220-1059(-)